MHQKERNKDRRNTDWDEPFIANMTWRMKHQALCRKLIVQLSDQRFERFSLKAQTKCGDPAFEKFLVAQGRPIGSFHLAHGITGKNAVTPAHRAAALSEEIDLLVYAWRPALRP